MHTTHLPALVTLSLAALSVAQKDRQAYCGNLEGIKAPNPAGCLDIKNHGVDPAATYGRDVWWSGNCKVRVAGPLLGGSSAPGADVQAAIQNILDTCDHGFEYIRDIKVEVYLCTVGSQQVECNSPLQHEIADAKRADMGISMGISSTVAFAPRRHLSNIPTTPNPNLANRALAPIPRDAEPYPGIICGGGPGSAQISDCDALAEQINGGVPDTKVLINLPYNAASQGCQVQIWPTTRDKKTAPASHVAAVIKEDAQMCADSSKSIIGFVENYLASDGRGAYHEFFGNFCGRLGQGSGDGCFPA
ncbi:hypothetical protein BCR34DRAFT_565768 [Clohesyomyces aquaticus]|uniref:Uncharacterized protein n=1 Tax=Clohesyomyces aquaticus TaxID=1231657 RepID=A0A1Y1ZLN4_9PLEO|nr:hypothetical protein BCR34DRAFT_565768 [Clohesyomyces aquaticus]